MSVRINLEIGHEASIRTKRTPEGFTHDWEVFVRGCDGAEIQYFVEKVVFYLHETFSKPRRVIKEPPYSVKESGYAGFNFPIEIYLRNKDEPKKIKFNYDLHLQPSGPAIIKVQKEKYVFSSPSEEFKHKLLKGGGVTVVPSNSQENSEPNRPSSEARNELINKPKLGGSDLAKKHKMKLDEPRIPNSFQDLFGTPITKTAKVFSESKPVPKDVNKNAGGKLEKDKDNKNKEKSKYSPLAKEKERDKQKDKGESDRKKEEKRSKDRSRERGHSKEISSKREKSPKPRSPSPKRSPKRIPSPKRPPSPPPMKHKDKEEKRSDSSKDKDKKDRLLQPDEKLEKKSKKEKRDKEHKENKHNKDKDPQKPTEYNKDHKKEQKLGKELARENESSPSLLKVERKDRPKEKDSPKETPKEAKDAVEVSPEKVKNDKVEEKQKHKHKKKDKERKDRDKEKSHKERTTKEKEKQTTTTKYPEVPAKEIREDKGNLFSSPKNEEKVKKATLFSEGEMDSSNSSLSSREDSITEPAEKVEQKKEALFEVVKKPPKVDFDKSKPKKEKSKKNKDKKGEREEKKRKRKSDRMEEEPVEKIPKEDAPSVIRAESSDSEQNSNASQLVEVEKENQENPEDYMQILRDLQHKIMTLQDNSELQKVVQLIAETGRYEVSARTFDFDLCLLEKSTVRQLQEFFASSS